MSIIAVESHHSLASGVIESQCVFTSGLRGVNGFQVTTTQKYE
jgi:hypothetical protein